MLLWLEEGLPSSRSKRRLGGQPKFKAVPQEKMIMVRLKVNGLIFIQVAFLEGHK